MPDITPEDIDALVAQGMSQRAIAKHLHIPRTTLQRIIARQQGLPDRPAVEVHTGITHILPRDEVAPERGVPADMVFDLVEMVE